MFKATTGTFGSMPQTPEQLLTGLRSRLQFYSTSFFFPTSGRKKAAHQGAAFDTKQTVYQKYT
jgi:hypothetical protein